MNSEKVILCILDGWGIREEASHNAINAAITPNWDMLCDEYGYAKLKTDGIAVGLPKGQMGNSEVGHMTIGAGRVVLQDLPKIDKAINENSLINCESIKELTVNLKNNGKTCHIMGCFSDGGVHAHIDHIIYLANSIAKQNIKVCVHAWLDGRDVAQKSAMQYLDYFTSKCQNDNISLSTLSGRYFAMDRDNRWDRVEKFYNASFGDAASFSNYKEAITHAYENDITDEFVEPCIINNFTGIQNGDGIIFANYRSDRVREISSALCDKGFSAFNRKHNASLNGVSLTEYSEKHNEFLKLVFPPEQLNNILPEIISNSGIKQLRVSETEKYAHITFFISGGREKEFDGEERILIPSPDVKTYDLKPEMASAEVTDNLVKAIDANSHGLIIVNFANTDMVGHTGNMQAATKAVEAVDVALGRLYKAASSNGYTLLVTADHGNAEIMQDEHGKPHTQHSLNLVPLLVANSKKGRQYVKDGDLADIAPTILGILDIDIPSEMSGKNLIAL